MILLGKYLGLAWVAPISMQPRQLSNKALPIFFKMIFSTFVCVCVCVEYAIDITCFQVCCDL